MNTKKVRHVRADDDRVTTTADDGRLYAHREQRGSRLWAIWLARAVRRAGRIDLDRWDVER